MQIYVQTVPSLQNYKAKLFNSSHLIPDLYLDFKSNLVK